mmetsp:Transcript_44993/g.97732  ORF Transcript_44993/g.97732 Transcript_44993/m.97732 type:complete len:604 (-) Transcript_44993:40-1851(-)
MEQDDDGIDVVVQSLDGPEQVELRVQPTSTFAGLRAALADELQIPDIANYGGFFKVFPNGERIPIDDSIRLGTRRNVCFSGVPFFVTVQIEPTNLENLDEFDPRAEIETPRSLLACAREGIDPQELVYTDTERFEEPGLPTRIATLRHDFVEAYRQDLLAIARRARVAVLAEQGEKAESESEAEGSASLPTLAQSSTMSCAGPGGIWAGPLLPHTLPACLAFFEGTAKFFAKEQLLAGALKHSTLTATRRQTASASRLLEYQDESLEWSRDSRVVRSTSSRAILEEAAGQVADLAARIRGTKRGSREGMQSVISRTEVSVAVQRRQDLKKLRRSHRDLLHTIGKQGEIASAQADGLDRHHSRVLERRDFMEKAHKENLGKGPGPPEGKWQALRAEAASRHLEYLKTRREVVHERQREEVEQRNKHLKEMTQRQLAGHAQARHLRDVQKVAVARRWLDRSTRWVSVAGEVRREPVAWNAKILAQQAEHEERAKDQRFRTAVAVQSGQELKALRRLCVSLSGQREERRRTFRRDAVATELRRLAGEKREESEDSLATMSATSRAVKRLARFDFPHMSGLFLPQEPEAVHLPPLGPSEGTSSSATD